MRILYLRLPSVSRTVARLALVAISAFAAACDKVPLLAPTESTITLSTNTTTLAANGTAEILATVIEQAGTPVHNGTTVTFTASVGTIEPRDARTENGIARATFRAGTNSGTARVGAFSGAARAEEVEILVGGAAAATVAVQGRAIFCPADRWHGAADRGRVRRERQSPARRARGLLHRQRHARQQQRRDRSEWRSAYDADHEPPEHRPGERRRQGRTGDDHGRQSAHRHDHCQSRPSRSWACPSRLRLRQAQPPTATRFRTSSSTSAMASHRRTSVRSPARRPCRTSTTAGTSTPPRSP